MCMTRKKYLHSRLPFLTLMLVSSLLGIFIVSHSTNFLAGSLLDDQVFTTFDTNHDGVFSVREMRKSVMLMIRAMSTYNPAYDLDGTGRVDRTDLVALITSIRRTLSAVCGNRVLENGEKCDDGNVASGDGCSNLCRLEPGFVCASRDPTVCTAAPLCGNGRIEGAEGCDDGNLASGDGCLSSCGREGGFMCDELSSLCVRHASCSLPAAATWYYGLIDRYPNFTHTSDMKYYVYPKVTTGTATLGVFDTDACEEREYSLGRSDFQSLGVPSISDDGKIVVGTFPVYLRTEADNNGTYFQIDQHTGAVSQLFSNAPINGTDHVMISRDGKKIVFTTYRDVDTDPFTDIHNADERSMQAFVWEKFQRCKLLNRRMKKQKRKFKLLSLSKKM